MNDFYFYSAPQHEAEPFVADALYTERRHLEAQLNLSDSAPTETLRVALRRYRSLFRQPSPY